MRKLILISVFVLASAAAQAGQSRGLIVAANDGGSRAGEGGFQVGEEGVQARQHGSRAELRERRGKGAKHRRAIRRQLVT